MDSKTHLNEGPKILIQKNEMISIDNDFAMLEIEEDTQLEQIVQNEDDE